MEQDSSNGALAKKGTPFFDSPVRVTIVHYRKRLADLDNLSGKALLDGVVAINILADDSTEQVAELRVTQIKAELERTVIEIEEI